MIPYLVNFLMSSLCIGDRYLFVLPHMSDEPENKGMYIVDCIVLLEFDHIFSHFTFM